MRVLVVGAGAIGSLVGYRLAASGHAVTLVGRAPWVKAVRSQGLGLEENGELRFQANLAAVTDIRALAGNAFDLVICTTKVYDTSEALGQVAPLIPAGVPLLFLQNGVGGEELAGEAMPQNPRLSGIITLVVDILSPGVIRLTTRRGGIGLAAVSPGSRVGDYTSLLQQAGFERVRAYDDYRAMKWSKLLLNILGNALPTILNMPPGELYIQRSLFDLERAAFCEALAVMRGLGVVPVSLPGYPVPLFAWSMTRLPALVLHPLFHRLLISGRGGKMPSLYLDLIKGKSKSEVDFLNGAVVSYAREMGLQVPANQALYGSLKAILLAQVPVNEFEGRPDKFLSDVGWHL